MLVLTRKTGEAITIGDDIHICVLEVDGNRTRIGIDAPRSVPVMRTELIRYEPADHDLGGEG